MRLNHVFFGGTPPMVMSSDTDFLWYPAFFQQPTAVFLANFTVGCLGTFSVGAFWPDAEFHEFDDLNLGI